MKADLASCRYGKHASNLGALLADALAREAGVKAYIVDPVVVDELCPAGPLLGAARVPRRSIFHALNQKATARKAAAALGQALRGMHAGRGAPGRRHLDRPARGRQGGRREQRPGRRGAVRDRAGRDGAGGRLDALRAGAGSTRTWTSRPCSRGSGGLVAWLGTNDFPAIEAAAAAWRGGARAAERGRGRPRPPASTGGSATS